MSTPVGYTARLIELMEAKKEDILDGRFDSKDLLNLKFKGTLWAHQQKIVDTLIDRTVGVIESPTGSGKSRALVNLIVHKKQPAIVLVHTIELANQMRDNINKLTDLNEDQIGFIGDGNWNIKPITVALLQSMHRLKDSTYEFFNKTFGLVICDEVHIVPAETFYSVMDRLNTKYKFGFSATPKRTDGLTKAIFFAAGPKVLTVPYSDVKDILLMPTIKTISTNYYFTMFNSNEYTYMINDLSLDIERNKLILDKVQQYKGRQIALLCARTSQVFYLTDQLKKMGFSVRYLTSNEPHPKKPGKERAMPKKDRQEVIKGLNDKSITIVVSTYGLFSTGIDIPSLEVLFFCAPVTSEILIRQSAGRLMRKMIGKHKPEIIDFVDERIALLKFQYYNRKRVYRTLEGTK
ncbi:MAG: DEAD/DEAH box helicase [Candidatus Hodarchaeales archaeon]